MPQQINGNQILVGNPTDANFGQSPNNVNVPSISSSDKLPDAIDKIVGILDKLAPAKSPTLATKFLSLQTTVYSARHVSSTSSVAGNILFSGSSITSTQSATAGNIYSNILLVTRPIANVSDSSSVNVGLATFSDGQQGTLYSYIVDPNSSDFISGNNPTLIGQRALDSTYYTQASASTSPDVGRWNELGVSNASGALQITFDGDPYNTAPNQGFWTSLKASMSSTYSLTTGFEYAYYMYQSIGATNYTSGITKFIYATGSGTPPSTTAGLVGGSTLITVPSYVTRYQSGVPSLSVGDIISASYSFINNGNLISRFYNTTQITGFLMTASSSTTEAKDLVSGVPISGGIPFAFQPTYSISGITVSVANSMYSTNATFTLKTYNPYGNVAAQSISLGGISSNGQTGNLFIDTVGNEIIPGGSSTRVYSGTFSYPGFTSSATYSQFFGPTYTTVVQQISLTQSGNEELQYLNGQFRYPSGDYTSNYPVVGPNYTSVPVGSFTVSSVAYRWVTFNVGSISGAQTLNLTINGSNTTLSTATLNTNIGRYISNFYMFIKVVGSNGTNWFDVNLDAIAAPTNDGDGCLVKSGSTAVFRRVSFGTVARTGTVYVRIGIGTTPGYTFQSVTLS